MAGRMKRGNRIVQFFAMKTGGLEFVAVMSHIYQQNGAIAGLGRRASQKDGSAGVTGSWPTATASGGSSTCFNSGNSDTFSFANLPAHMSFTIELGVEPHGTGSSSGLLTITRQGVDVGGETAVPVSFFSYGIANPLGVVLTVENFDPNFLVPISSTVTITSVGQ